MSVKHQGIITEVIHDVEDITKTTIKIQLTGELSSEKISFVLCNILLKIHAEDLKGKKVAVFCDATGQTLKKILATKTNNIRGVIYEHNPESIETYHAVKIDDIVINVLSTKEQHYRIQRLLKDPMIRPEVESRYACLPPYIKQYFYLEPISYYEDISPADYQKIVFFEQLTHALQYFSQHADKERAEELACDSYEVYINEITDNKPLYSRSAFLDFAKALAREYDRFQDGKESKTLESIKMMHKDLHKDLTEVFGLNYPLKNFYTKHEADKITCLYYMQDTWRSHAHLRGYYQRLLLLYNALKYDVDMGGALWEYPDEVTINDHIDQLVLDKETDFNTTDGIHVILEKYISMPIGEFGTASNNPNDILINVSEKICDDLEPDDGEDKQRIEWCFVCLQMLKEIYEKKGNCYESVKNL